jgi:hypothetical protein
MALKEKNRVSLNLKYALPSLVVTLILAQPALAHAYIGPAAAVSFFGAACGLLVAIFSAIGVLLLWPVRALFRLIRRTAVRPAEESSPVGTDPQAITDKGTVV